MPREKKLTLNVTDEVHLRLEQIGDELGITTTDLLRRAIGLVSITHSLLQEASDDLYICAKDEEGAFQQRHTLSSMLY